jgi:hypothetical protein
MDIPGMGVLTKKISEQSNLKRFLAKKNHP